jgi:hypothetical protein
MDFHLHRRHFSLYFSNDVQGCDGQNNAVGGQAFAADVKFQQRFLPGAHGAVKALFQHQPGIEVVAFDTLLQCGHGIKQGHLNVFQFGHLQRYFGAALVHDSHARPGLKQVAKNNLHDQGNDGRVDQGPQENGGPRTEPQVFEQYR